MKVFAVVAVVVISIALGAQALTDEQKQKIAQYHKECQATTKVDQALIDKVRKGEFTNDPKLKEQLFCFAKKAGLQNEKGEIQANVLKTKLITAIKNEQEANALMAKCNVKKDTPQNTAFETIKCYYTNSNKKIILV